MTRRVPSRYGARPLPRDLMLTPTSYRRNEYTAEMEALHEHQQTLHDGGPEVIFPAPTGADTVSAGAEPRAHSAGRPSGPLSPPSGTARPTPLINEQRPAESPAGRDGTKGEA